MARPTSESPGDRPGAETPRSPSGTSRPAPPPGASPARTRQEQHDPKEWDIVLWGATGFTGRLVARYLAEHPDVTSGRVSLALAGRDREKLEALRRELTGGIPASSGPPSPSSSRSSSPGSRSLSPRSPSLPLVVADALDPESLRPMVARARVICTTVGPYARFGTPLARLCAELGTDSCDLSGEVPWMRRTVDELHEPAKASGARIVHCCGFDSIPSDLGVFLAHRRLAAEGRSLRRARMRVRSIRGKMSGGTVASLFEIMAEARADRAVRRLLADPYALVPERSGERRPRAGRTSRKRSGGAALDSDRGMWTAPFLMSGINTRIVRRSNALLGDPYGTDFRYDEAVDTGRGLPGRLRATAVSAALTAFTAAAALPATAWALRAFLLPDPGEGPSAAERERGRFRIDVFGESGGESGDQVGDRSGDQAQGKADGPSALRVRTRVAVGLDPGYGATARMLGESALCLALGEADGLPGGVLTPASALGMPLVERLRAVGFQLEAALETGE